LRKLKYSLTVTALILLLSISMPILQVTNVSTAAVSYSVGISQGNLGVVQREMSASELEEYKDYVGTYVEGQNYNKIVSGYGTGLSPPTESQWEDIVEKAYLVEQVSYQASLPTAVDHSVEPWFPPIGNQGQQGSCASFAVGYYCKTYQEAKEHQWDLSGALWTGGSSDGNISLAYQSEVMSPAFVYNLINGGEDVGSNFETAIQLVSNVGVCSWAEMPYYWQDCTRWPTEAAWAEAPFYRCNSTYSYQYLYANTAQGVESLKSWLAAGNLAVIAVDATDNLWNYDTNTIALNSRDIFTEDSYTVGPLDHAATIVGYDDQYSYSENGVTTYGAFKIANSWGVGGWENIPDGCYWISYAAMRKMSTDNPAVLFQDLAGYQPEILATFNISHEYRGDCDIVFGLGTPSNPVVTKSFSVYVDGGDQHLPFCTNNVVFDLTDLKSYLTSPYNQSFFMKVFDKGVFKGGTTLTGTINYFAVEGTSSSQTPVVTVNYYTVSLTLIHSFDETSLSVSPTSGPPNGEVTLSGVGFSGNPVNISYYNPVALQWVSIIENYAVSSDFNYTIHAPDLQQVNLQGDAAAASDSLLFRVQDGVKSYNTSYTQFRRGLIQVGGQTAHGVFGNNTDLSAGVFVQNGQTLRVAGEWFSPGAAVVLWDGQSIGASTVDEVGFFNTSVTVPSTTAGQHTLTVADDYSNVTVMVTRLPTVTTDYADVWHTQDFTITLTPDYSVTEIYYRINDGQTQAVSVNGQPAITSEGAGNKLEYWSTWSIYGAGSMELSHTTLTGIKLDKTGPEVSLQINGGLTDTTSNTVTLTVSASDSVAGIKQVRYSNDIGVLDQAVWESFSPSKVWALSSGSGTKTVYCQIQDNAGQTTTVSASITVISPQNLEAQSPTATASPTAEPSPSPTSMPTVPECDSQIVMLLFALLMVSTLIAVRCKKSADAL
jgi:hypothetical protein